MALQNRQDKLCDYNLKDIHLKPIFWLITRLISCIIRNALEDTDQDLTAYFIIVSVHAALATVFFPLRRKTCYVCMYVCMYVNAVCMIMNRNLLISHATQICQGFGQVSKLIFRLNENAYLVDLLPLLFFFF